MNLQSSFDLYIEKVYQNKLSDNELQVVRRDFMCGALTCFVDMKLIMEMDIEQAVEMYAILEKQLNEEIEKHLT